MWSLSCEPSGHRERRRDVVRFSDGSAGLALSTVRRRLSSVSGFYAHLVALGEVESQPGAARHAGASTGARDKRVVPLVRPVRHLPRVLDPTEVTALLGGLRKHRDRAIDRSDAAGRAASQRSPRSAAWPTCVGVSAGCSSPTARAAINGWCRSRTRFFTSPRAYLDTERPADAATDRVFVVLKGPNRGQPLTAKGLEEIITGARTAGRARRMGRATSCATPASPGCERRACRSKRCRPRPVTARSRRPRSICIWPTTGSPASTSVRLRPIDAQGHLGRRDGRHDDARRSNPNRSIDRWARITAHAPMLAATCQHYLDQIAVSVRPAPSTPPTSPCGSSPAGSSTTTRRRVAPPASTVATSRPTSCGSPPARTTVASR